MLQLLEVSRLLIADHLDPGHFGVADVVAVVNVVAGNMPRPDLDAVMEL